MRPGLKIPNEDKSEFGMLARPIIGTAAVIVIKEVESDEFILLHGWV